VCGVDVSEGVIEATIESCTLTHAQSERIVSDTASDQTSEAALGHLGQSCGGVRGTRHWSQLCERALAAALLEATVSAPPAESAAAGTRASMR
jgi:hypothetical protein